MSPMQSIKDFLCEKVDFSEKKLGNMMLSCIRPAQKDFFTFIQ